MAELANVEGLVARKTGKDSRTWYYRLAVPIRDQERAGCKDIWVSLRTPDKAVAIRALPRAIEQAQSKLETKLKCAAPSVTKPVRADPETLEISRLSQKVYDAHYLWVKDHDFVERAELFEKALADVDAFHDGRLVQLPRTPFMYMLLEDGETPLADFLAYYWINRHEERARSLQTALSAGDASEGIKHLDQHLSKIGVTVAEKAQRIVLSRAVIQAEIDALDDIRQADETRYQALLERIASDRTTSASTTQVKEPEQTSGPLLSVAATGWISEKSSSSSGQRQRRSWSAKRKATCEATLALFIAIVGDKPVDTYKKADARDFKQVLSGLPPNRSKLKEIRDLGVREAAKRARELGLPTMSVVNINKQITIISSLFDWLLGHEDCLTTNPFAKTTIDVKSVAREERDPFAPADLTSIFTAPIFTGCLSEAHWKQSGSTVLRESAKYWVPLLGLYTGARLNELCKLRTVDVKNCDSIHYIDINAAEHEDKNIDPRLKGAASARQIPVHPDLAEFGFLSLVATRQANKTERLFPELTPDSFGKLDLAPGRYSLITGVRSGYGPTRTSLQTRWA